MPREAMALTNKFVDQLVIPQVTVVQVYQANWEYAYASGLSRSRP